VVAGCSRGQPTIDHPDYFHFQCDVADEKAVVRLVREVAREYGTIDFLLNNAGIAAMNHILTTPYQNAKNVFNTNFFGTFLFSREVAKLMAKRKSGSIVNYSTIAVPLDLEGESVYAASKAAIESFTRVSAKEFGKFGVRVNAVGPTPIKTDLIRNIPDEKLQELLYRQSIPRLGEINDVINVIDFFNSDKSRFITGQVLYLGGVFH